MAPSEEGVNLDSLTPGSSIDVETHSHHYLIECLGGDAIRISGHPQYCPDPVPAQLHGSVNMQGRLEAGHIERGMRLIFFLNGSRPLTTSRVVSLHVNRPNMLHARS
jgi:hypothetical protein